MKNSKAIRTILEILLLIFLIYAFGVLLVRGKEKQELAEMNNLLILGMGLSLYANDHDDHYPSSIDVLYREGYLKRDLQKDFTGIEYFPPSTYPVPDGYALLRIQKKYGMDLVFYAGGNVKLNRSASK